MAKSRYHKKSRSNRRKTQQRRRQRGGSWYDPRTWGKGDPTSLPLSEDNVTINSYLETSVNGSDLSKEEEEVPKPLEKQPSFFKTGSNDLSKTTTEDPNKKPGFFSFLGLGGGRRGRKSSRRSNLKRKL